MIEKVNKFHPDKVADRIAGALVDLAYTKNNDPRIAVEVLLGHNLCTVIIETDLETDQDITEQEIQITQIKIKEYLMYDTRNI